MAAVIVQFEGFATVVSNRAFVTAWDSHARRRIPTQVATAQLYGESGQGAPYRYISRSTWQAGAFEDAHPDGAMPADRTTGDIRATRIGGYRLGDDGALLDVGRDEAIVLAFLADASAIDALQRVATPIRHRQWMTAYRSDQQVATIVEWFVAQDHAHRLRRELLQIVPTAAIGVYQREMLLDTVGVQRDVMTRDRAGIA
ncbi:MAG: hypothetical protein MUE41_05870 [Gemmatimonadaceae bacterium]|jgi:hypothetical protein|nr:hypothetical protein [Gemmatimonadaceae bacterium]